MKTTIYYFTGTGNSLYAAKEIAKKIKNAEVVSVKKAMNEGKLKTDGNKIGIVFPVIAWGAPLLVEEFLAKFKFDAKQYIFSIATCGGTSGNANLLVDKILKKRGLKLSAGYVLRAASYSRSDKPTILPIRISKILSKKVMMNLKTTDQRIDEIARDIDMGRIKELEKSTFLGGVWGDLIHDRVLKVFEKDDKNFWVDNKCDACGICAKICPSCNIEVSDKPQWKGNCSACYACFQWCPKAAIQYKQESFNVVRKRNKNITLKEMMD